MKVKVDVNAVKEAVKEVARVAFLAGVTAAVGWAGQQLAGLDPNSVYYVVGTLVLRAVDKYVHKSSSKLNGVAPF